MVEVEQKHGGISYLFTSNHATLLRSSGFFPSLLFSPAAELQVRASDEDLENRGRYCFSWETS